MGLLRARGCRYLELPWHRAGLPGADTTSDATSDATSDGTPTPDRVARTAPIEDADPQ